eukprot:maker-scaffold_18-snap-gene-3.0-mRNA-1 protein AED:0.00 eAED:0.00 QI:193/1/1/1/1/1/5/755/333
MLDKPEMSILANKDLNITSMAVFRKFVVHDNNGTLVKESILSRECFELWIQTRKRSVKHPKDSFRRVITAHIRGADDRTPFCEQVEKSLLKKLRMVDHSGDLIDHFSLLAGVDTSTQMKNKIRMKLYQVPYGFHERVRFRTGVSNFREASVPKNMLEEKIESKISRILNMTEAGMKHCLSHLKRKNLSISLAALVYLLECTSFSSVYFSKDYILPSIDEQKFRTDLPICKFIANRVTLEVSHMDENFIRMFSTRTVAPLLTPSICEFFNCVRLTKRVLEENGHLWLRSTVDLNNKIFPCKIFVIALVGNIDEVSMQVETDREISKSELPHMFL